MGELAAIYNGIHLLTKAEHWYGINFEYFDKPHDFPQPLAGQD
jgi:hypothetical protein